MKIIHSLTLCLLLTSPLVASAQFLDDPNDSMSGMIEKAVIGGELVTSDSRVAKTTVSLVIDSSETINFCSGTLITKDLVLTAAHCLTNLDKPWDSTLSVTGTVNGKEKITGDNWVVHPQYQRTSGYSFFNTKSPYRNMHDLALVKLNQPVSSAAVITELPDREIAIGTAMEVLVAGFGRIGPKTSSNGDLYFAWTTGTFTTLGDDHQIEMTGVQPCHGDSGGPVFQADANHLVLLGVTSHGDPQCVSFGSATAVDIHLPWIRESAQKLRSTQHI